MLSPIVLFVYNRPSHTRKTLESLKQNDLSKESKLFIYSDGPKADASEEQMEKIEETRKIIKEEKWCGEVAIIERERNMGLANSIIAGVTEIINRFGKIIVLEDDLILSPHFLDYMNEALARYEKNNRVMQISGYMFPIEISLKDDAFFLPFTTSWGWATWKRSWDCFDPKAQGIKLLEDNKKLREQFDLSNAYPYYRMLKDQQRGKVNSWAIRFYLSVFLKKGLTLYPRKTLVNNMGFDGSGVHCRDGIMQSGVKNLFEVKKYPQAIEVNPEIKNLVFKFLGSQGSYSKRFYAKLINFLKIK